jgi:hypothetical protein
VKPDDPQVSDIPNMHTAAYWVDLRTKTSKLSLQGEPGLNPGFVGISANQLLTLARGQRGFEIQSRALP